MSTGANDLEKHRMAQLGWVAFGEFAFLLTEVEEGDREKVRGLASARIHDFNEQMFDRHRNK